MNDLAEKLEIFWGTFSPFFPLETFEVERMEEEVMSKECEI